MAINLRHLESIFQKNCSISWITLRVKLHSRAHVVVNLFFIVIV